jgi:hypothetical protein
MKYSEFMTKPTVSLAGLASIVVTALLILPSPALAAGDANEASCPNEGMSGFESHLPDCRAYEMVSPPFEDGGDDTVLQAVSGTGTHVIISSLSGFAGTENNPLDDTRGAVYQLVRTGSGWTASSVTPSASMSPNAYFQASSSDGASDLWEVVGSVHSIYSGAFAIREPNGAFTEVGPLLPPAAQIGPPATGENGGESKQRVLIGATGNLSHMLFTIIADDPESLWPGDTTEPGTNDRSLYEYEGVGNSQPRLVGVGTSGGLISDCGTSLGAPAAFETSDTYNAISADGETVFFTALGYGESDCKHEGRPAVGQLYARLGHSQTVGISEPSTQACSRCAVGEPKTALFQGASEDGSKVFFTTAQELFAGNEGQNLYEYDFDALDGEKVVRVSRGAPGYESQDPGVLGVARVSEDGSHVYFVATEALTGPNAEGESPVQSAGNLYMFERDSNYPTGRTVFVTTLTDNDAELDWSGQNVHTVQATPGGEFLVFDSHADIMGNLAEQSQVLEYDAQTEKLIRISVGAAGYPSGAKSAETYGSSIDAQHYGEYDHPTEATTRLAVSANGLRIVFYSQAALTEGAEEGKENVYEYERGESVVEPDAPGRVYLIATNVENAGTSIGIDSTGADVFFETLDRLSPADVDSNRDIYDAREDGGFPVSSHQSCDGEACQGAPSAPPPLFGAPASVSVSGSGDFLPPAPTTLAPTSKPTTGVPKPVKCQKHFIRKKGKCVRKTKPKKKSKTLRNHRRDK